MFSKSANPLYLTQKSTIRPCPSIRKPNHPPPQRYLMAGHKEEVNFVSWRPYHSTQGSWVLYHEHLPSSIYTRSDLGVLSNLIGSLSLANEHYSPPTGSIMRKPNKNKMAGVNSRFATVSESEILKIQEDAVPENIRFSTQSCEHGIISGGSFANCSFNFHFK